MSKLRTVFLTIVVLLVLGLAGAALFVGGGLYHVGSTRQHWQPVYSLLETTMRQSVRLRARGIEVPPLDSPQLVARGAQCFRDKCVQCHGAPGVAQGDIGRSMQPLPGPLVDAHLRWQPREVYWITRHGIRMSGMPAWEYRLSEQDLWAVTAFVGRLPSLSAQDYARATQPGAGAACGRSQAERDAQPARPPDVERGRTALYQYACTACHTVPGLTGSSPQVGPPLTGMARRALIAGRLANTPQNMVAWLRSPQRFDPATAMPDMEVTQEDALDMAAYLATLQ